jgi:hypothetical protein
VVWRQADAVSREIREPVGGGGEGAVALRLLGLEEMMHQVGRLPHHEREKGKGSE